MTVSEGVTMTLADWLEATIARGKLDCRFKCPRCGNVATMQDFKDLGVNPERAAKECIGRIRPAKMAGGEFEAGPDGGCDWAAYGLLDICVVHVEVEGKRIPVFEFADEAPA